MGASSSRIEDDKALVLCRERRRFVRQALDGRCALAAEHVSYIQSLRNTGTALRKFAEPEGPAESSLYTSTSATPGPLILTDKSTSQFSNSSPSLLQNVERDSFSPAPSPPHSGRFYVGHMKSSRSFSTTVEERPPTVVTSTLKTSSITPKLSETPPAPPGTPPSDETPLPPDTPPWDYFGFFHPIDNQFSFQEGKLLSHGLDNADVIRRLREEEGIPDLEEEGEKVSIDGRDDSVDSEDDFDQPSTEPLVQTFRNRIENLDHHLIASPTHPSTDLDNHSIASLTHPSTESIGSETEQQNGEKSMPSNGTLEAHKTLEMAPSKTTPSVAPPANEKEKEASLDHKFVKKDFFSCIKEIEVQFLMASDSGREVFRMLEANKVQYRPLFTEETAHRPKISMILSACFSCCTEEIHPPLEPSSNEIKYLTWHRSMSSRSSSSRNPLGASTRDDIDGLSSDLFSSMYMNSGSHSSTLDRLYAWERKLYDEVKASGIIRREYDVKCKLLRQQESTGESQYRIDKTRATVKDLHSRIQVAIHRIDSISQRIEELRDKELQPQLEELIGGLTRMWAMMLDCHKNQYNIIQEASNSSRASIRSESQRQATIVLEHELKSLSSSFPKWIAAHKSYLQSINLWLLKCVFPLRHKSSRRRNTVQFSPGRDIAPPIFVTCRDWLRLLDELPTKEVGDAGKELVGVISSFLPRQEKARGVNEAPVDWSMNYDTLQNGLVVYFDRLKTFAESALPKYKALQVSIGVARVAYDNAVLRK